MFHFFIESIDTFLDNILDVGNILHRFSFMPVGNAFVSVDTFFMLGYGNRFYNDIYTTFVSCHELILESFNIPHDLTESNQSQK